MPTTVFVYANPSPGKEAEFDLWYADHLQEVVDACGFASGTRYELTEYQSRQDQPYRSVTVYESDEADAEALYRHMQSAFSDMAIPDCIDIANTHVSLRSQVARATKRGPPGTPSPDRPISPLDHPSDSPPR